MSDYKGIVCWKVTACEYDCRAVLGGQEWGGNHFQIVSNLIVYPQTTLQFAPNNKIRPTNSCFTLTIRTRSMQTRYASLEEEKHAERAKWISPPVVRCYVSFLRGYKRARIKFRIPFSLYVSYFSHRINHPIRLETIKLNDSRKLSNNSIMFIP